MKSLWLSTGSVRKSNLPSRAESVIFSKIDTYGEVLTSLQPLNSGLKAERSGKKPDLACNNE